MSGGEATGFDREIAAISAVYTALKELDQDSQARVLDYVIRKLGMQLPVISTVARTPEPYMAPIDREPSTSGRPEDDAPGTVDHLEGVSPLAKKWIRRNDLDAEKLSSIFSLGVEEIDLVVRSMPGKTKKDKMRGVLLLTGAAAYLGSGVARFTYERLKEACAHYDAFDSGHFAVHMNDFAPEVSGSKTSGYTLTARGLAAAADLLKEMTV